MQSLAVLALSLSLFDLSSAAITQAQRDTQQSEVALTSDNSVIAWFNKLIGKDTTTSKRQADDRSCVIDNYYNFVFNSSFGENVCRALLHYPDQTVVADTTPVSTFITTFTTRVQTHTSIIRTTPYTTVTVTADPARKRDAEATPVLRLDDIFNTFRQQHAAASSPNSDLMSSSFSSACQCQTYAGSTVTSTYTAAPTIITLSAFDQADTTIFETRTAALRTTTLTVNPANSPTGNVPVNPSNVPSTTDLTLPAEPTAPAFTCPEDNNSTVSQLIGTMRYDYLILCDTDITDPDFYGVLYYSSFSECAAACSVANTRLQSPVCGGFSYYGKVGDQGYNCFLKGTTNSTVPASGVNSGLLQRVAVGLSKASPAGTNTESAPFVGETPTGSPGDMSSFISSALGNSTTSIGVTSPPPLFVASGRLVPGATSYSTYVSNGQTFSTGTVYSTYHSASGTWYYSYYTSYSLAWSSATTVYAASETSTTIANTTNSESNTGNGANGDHWTVTTTNSTSYFPGGYNVTQVISNVTFDASGNEIASSATTNYYSYETGGAGGGFEGGNGSGGGGIITSTSAFSTYTVINNGGQTGGASSFYTGGVAPTPAPSFSARTIINTFGTAYSSGYIVSGGGGGTGGANSTAASGVAGSSGAPSSQISSTVVSTGIASESELAESDALTPISSTLISTETAGESGGVGSGALTPVSATTVLTGINGENGTVASGALTPISSTLISSGLGGGSSTEGSGAIPSSGIPFTNSERPRSGTYSTAFTILSGSVSIVPSGSGPIVPLGNASTIFASSSAAKATRPSGGSITQYIPYPSGPVSYPEPLPSSDSPFTNSNGDRTRIPSGASSSDAPSSSVPFVPPGSALSNVTPSGPAGYLPSTGTVPIDSQLASISSTYNGDFAPPTASRPVGNSSSGVPFTNTNGDRTRRPSSTGPTRSAPRGTALSGTGPTVPGVSLPSTFPPYPTAASSCVTNYFGTTTIFTTVTEWGCYSNCAPDQGNGYGPLTFGPAQVGGPGRFD